MSAYRLNFSEQNCLYVDFFFFNVPSVLIFKYDCHIGKNEINTVK